VDNITGGERGERATGTPNTIYDLSSVLYHALEGGASYDTYIEDAEREGDQELVDFFRRVRDEDSIRADEAQMLLAERTPTATATTSTVVEPVEGATAPSEGMVAGAPRREETVGRVEGRPDMGVAPTDPAIGAGRVEPDVSPRTEEAAPPPRREAAPPPRREGGTQEAEGEREEDKGLIEKAKDALVGEEEPRSREGTDRPERR
jgi:hypothetical protein